VEDRRQRDSYVDAIVRSRSLEFGSVLRAAKRDELKEGPELSAAGDR
jgi:hypothetical protein